MHHIAVIVSIFRDYHLIVYIVYTYIYIVYCPRLVVLDFTLFVPFLNSSVKVDFKLNFIYVCLIKLLQIIVYSKLQMVLFKDSDSGPPSIDEDF